MILILHFYSSSLRKTSFFFIYSGLTFWICRHFPLGLFILIVQYFSFDSPPDRLVSLHLYLSMSFSVFLYLPLSSPLCLSVYLFWVYSSLRLVPPPSCDLCFGTMSYTVGSGFPYHNQFRILLMLSPSQLSTEFFNTFICVIGSTKISCSFWTHEPMYIWL